MPPRTRPQPRSKIVPLASSCADPRGTPWARLRTGRSRARARRFVRHGPILLRFCHDGSHMRTVRSHDGSGSVGREFKAIEEATQSGKHAGTDSGTNYNVAHHHNQAPWSNATPSPTTSRRGCALMRWGLLPPWTKTSADGAPDTKGPAHQRPRRAAHQLAGVPHLRQTHALPGAEGHPERLLDWTHRNGPCN
ncbi:MAG: hypothetical protein QOI01_7053 [Mycobacterium sp.]|nr:hypothetical protein [Mycobacterium sp.]